MSLSPYKRILVTGGAGFIGSNLVRMLLAQGREVRVLDKLSYAGHRESLLDLKNHSHLTWSITDLCELAAVRNVVRTFCPDAVMHLAAESHVDRSIAAPVVFAQSNVLGTVNLLEALREQLADQSLPSHFRMIHVSTDEVFGSLGESGAFTEESPHRPNSPYAASKGAADHFARAYRNTYGAPIHITHSSNNYGPYQHPEKLVPVVLSRALRNESIPVYGTGEQVRDWIHVEDHCRALLRVLEQAPPQEDYVIGAETTLRNIDLVHLLCKELDVLAPRSDGRAYAEQIRHVTDRPGHDYRYSINPKKLKQELGWATEFSVEEGMRATVAWYLAHQSWWLPILESHGET